MRKKIISIVLMLVLIPTIAIAGTASEQIKVQKNIATVTVNGEKIAVDNFIYNGTTYVPLRAVSENMGASVDWDNATKTAKILQNQPDSSLNNEQKALVLQYVALEMYYDYLYDAYTEVYYTILNKDTGDIYNQTVGNLNNSKIPDKLYAKFVTSGVESLKGLAQNHDFYIDNLNTCLKSAQNPRLSAKEFDELLDFTLKIGDDIIEDRGNCRDDIINNLAK